MFFSACRDFFYVYFCRRIATPHSEPGSEKAGQRFQKIKKLKNQKIMKKTNNIFNIRVGKQPRRRHGVDGNGHETDRRRRPESYEKV